MTSSAKFPPMNDSEQAVGFWSYTHRDDELNRGRIRQLARDISDEFELITGDELKIFVDKESLDWGAEWRSRIDSALAGTTFCIPIITPAFFKSADCRSEVLTFFGHAKSLGLDELLLPILYVPVSGLDEDNPDEVVSLISGRQYVDWTTLRLTDVNSQEYRQAVADLAVRLTKILEHSVKVASEYEATLESAPDDSPALLETMAAAELALPRWSAVMEELAEVIQVVVDETAKAADEIAASDARGGGFAGRLRVSHNLAERMTPTVDRMYELGDQYAAELVSVDPGVLTLIRELPKQILTPEEEISVADFFSTVETIVASSRVNVAAAQGFHDGVGELAALSKAMRPVIRKIQAATRKVMDCQSILEEWSRLLDASTADPVQ